MDYEKAYKELVKNFKDVLNFYAIKLNGAVPVEYIVKMIPELKETEDNSVKEELIKFLNNYINAHGCTEMSKWVSWIEKQEQSDLVSFINHERDKKGFYHWGKEVSWNEMPLDVRKHDYPYYFEDDLDCFPFNVGKQDEQKNLLNFDEAEKEKNDFVSGQFIECRKSFNEFKELESYWLEYVGDDTYIGRSDNILNQKFHITPRQLFTLFTHEHCKKYYENQAEQKAPIDIDKMVADYKNNPEKNNESFGKPINCMIRAYRQGLNDAIGKIVLKPVEWTEDDESWFKELELMALSFSNDDSYKKKFFEWLKSLKYRVQPQAKKELSDEDERIKKEIIYYLDREITLSNFGGDIATFKKWIAWLEKQCKNKSSWSEEDERHRKRIVERLEDIRKSKEDNIDVASVILSEINWLNSLKPQPCWKPTEEQMRDFGLLLDYNIGVFDYKKYMTVYSLYEDLKKITEE